MYDLTILVVPVTQVTQILLTNRKSQLTLAMIRFTFFAGKLAIWTKRSGISRALSWATGTQWEAWPAVCVTASGYRR